MEGHTWARAVGLSLSSIKTNFVNARWMKKKIIVLQYYVHLYVFLILSGEKDFVVRHAHSQCTQSLVLV
jgi:hypothetical protein